MRRILYVTDSLMAGGIESQLVELVTRLRRSDYEPYVLCLYGPTVRALRYAPDLQAAGVPFHSLDLNWNWHDKAAAIRAIIAHTRTLQPTIIQAEGYHANLLTRLASPFLPPTQLIGSVRGLHTRKQLLYEQLSHRVCKRFVVNAPHLKDMLVTHAHLPPEKIAVILNGITLERYAAPHDAQLRRRLAPDARLLIVSMGRISFEKNMHWIVEALGRLREQCRLPHDMRLWIVGPVQHQQAQQLLNETITKYALGSIVTQFPPTPHPEDYYYASDVCLLFSPSEGLANVAIESFAASRPLIISANANAANMVVEGQTGWIVPTANINELAATLSEVLVLPNETLRAMQQQCWEAAQQFSAKRMVAEYEQLYATL